MRLTAYWKQVKNKQNNNQNKRAMKYKKRKPKRPDYKAFQAAKETGF